MDDPKNQPPGGVVLGVEAGATPTAATIVLTTPSGKKVPIGVLNTTEGTFRPTTEGFMAWWKTLPTALPDQSDQPWNNGGVLSVS